MTDCPLGSSQPPFTSLTDYKGNHRAWAGLEGLSPPLTLPPQPLGSSEQAHTVQNLRSQALTRPRVTAHLSRLHSRSAETKACLSKGTFRVPASRLPQPQMT